MELCCLGMKKTLLRVLRAAHEPRLSQRQVALRAGMARLRYWQIENGDGPPATTAERAAVAAALDTSVTAIAWPELPKAKAS